MRILVIGYGSPIRGDDAIGPLAADRLESEGVPPGVTPIARHILTADLVAELAECDRAIFLDAAATGEPGEIRCRTLVPSRATVSTLAHSQDPRELLAWCETLHGRVPESILITAAGANFDYADYRLSPVGERALTAMLAETRRWLTPAPTTGPTDSGAARDSGAREPGAALSPVPPTGKRTASSRP